MGTYRPKHLNSTGGIGGAIVSAIFMIIAWLDPDLPAPPAGLEGILTIIAAFILSQFGHVRLSGGRGESATDE